MGPTQNAGLLMRAKIFVTYHKDTHLVKGGIIEPIQVGNGADLMGFATRDNTGANIAKRNDCYCEMTAAYWAWQNAGDFDYIGLMHYRRFLDFNKNDPELDEWGVANWPSFTTDFTTRFGLDDASIAAAIGNYDIVLPRQWSVINAGFRNLYEHYTKAPYHHEADLTRCRDVVAEACPGHLQSWDEVFQNEWGWFNNMFIMRSELFHSYCSWLFPLLQEMEKKIPLQDYTTQERRVLGYLAERLLNVWVRHYIKEYPTTSIAELDRIFIEDPSRKVWDPVRENASDETISVVVASDNAYVPHLGTLIASLFDNAAPGSEIDLLILDGGISPENQGLLKRLVPGNSSIHFIPMQHEFSSYFTHMHFSRATFYRLALDKILASREKVIYIDCDTVVLGDLGELWALDMDGKPIAAVHDYIMESFCQARTLSADFTGSLQARAYLEDYLGIAPESCDQYFQAGVLVMNLRLIREMDITEKMIASLHKRKYWFLDQDVLNKYFCGSQARLPAQWNVINMIDDISSNLQAARVQELKEARTNAKLIHYAGYEAKPWVNRSAPLGHYYFFYLRRTFWYEDVMGLGGGERHTGMEGKHGSNRSRRWQHILRTLWRKMPVRMRQIANPAAYSLRRWLIGG